MTEKLTPTQTLLMWCLLAKQGVAKQSDIRPKIDAKDRKALESILFVSSSKKKGYGNAIWLKLEDKGWSWAPHHLCDPLPAAHSALHALMTRLHHHLASADRSLADFIGVSPQIEDNAEPNKAQSVSFRDIKAAYGKATGQQTALRVLLKDLRRNLPQVPRAVLDQALCREHLGGKIILMRLDNPAEITQEVKSARVDFKGIPMDLIWIAK